MAAPPVIERTATYHHTRVGRTELDKLLRVAGEGAPAGTVSVKCTVGSVQLQEDTLDDLIAVRAALPHVSDRTPWNNLTLERDDASGHIDVAFKDGVVTVTVRSTDPIWTHGQMHRLGEILDEAHGWLAPIQWRMEALQASLLLGVGIYLFILDLPADVMRDGWYYFNHAAYSVAIVTGVYKLLKIWLQVRSMKPVLKVTGEVEWGSTWSRLTNGDRISVVGAVIAALTLLATAAALF
ncbi:hypothetical protein [Streptomyces gilvus]|uniref:hypothetical protein n=1 Tax=Streptomyces gilvus TaxID=2920937 RepID=UPI001F0D2BCB|nr:hypothetical protein [Streptomyces sp. CME 23]MCH5677914.1 hypothetical protein [Streptomyces sp. CME 23]